MAGEALLINPRHRRRRARRKKARGSHRRRRAARRNPFAMNPRRRRRVGRRRSHARRSRRRAHRNPRLPLLGSVNLNAIGAGAAGYIGTRYATGFLLSVLPPQWSADPNTAPLVRIGAKALVGIVGLPMIAKLLKVKGMAGPLAIGGGIAVAVDLFETYLAKMVPIPMADYEQQVLTDYETRQLTGYEDGEGMSGAGAFGGSAFGSGAY